MFDTLHAFITQHSIHLVFRMVLACLCGIAIGFERKNRAKEGPASAPIALWLAPLP